MEDKLVVLAEHPYERALLIKARLESEGIDTVLSNVNLIQPDASAGVKIKIREEDLEQAMDIYKQFVRDEGAWAEKETDKAKISKKSGVKKILVPVDFSDYAQHASHFAMLYASKVGAEILYLHAYYAPDMQTIPYDESFGFEGSVTEYLNDLRDTAREELKKFLKRLRKIAEKENYKNLLMDYTVVKGPLDDAVFYAVESYKPDLIIMGARGKDKRKHDPIGSTTTRILEKASLPVLIIPEDMDLKGFFERRKILYATDYDEADFEAISKLMNLIRPFHMDIVCMHIGRDKEDPGDHLKMEGLKEYFRKSYPKGNITCDIIHKEDVIAGIDEYISKNPVSAIAMTTHKRNLIEKIFYPSITRKMFFYTTVPLMVFHS